LGLAVVMKIKLTRETADVTLWYYHTSRGFSREI
jgi:hypothetical protein